jgi:hypothetical protein
MFYVTKIFTILCWRGVVFIICQNNHDLKTGKTKNLSDYLGRDELFGILIVHWKNAMTHCVFEFYEVLE